MSTVRKNDARTARMLKLMAYADGELEGAELEEVEGWIADDGMSVRFTNELAGLGELVQLGFKKSADAKAVASFDIADAIMAKVKDEKITPKSAESSEKKAAPLAPVISLSRTRAQRNVRFGVAAVATLALAASIFFIMKNGSGTEQPMARTPVVEPATMPAAVAVVTPASSNSNAASGGVDVNVEQTAGNSVSVFYVPSETESLSTSVVVWVDDTGGK